MYAQSSSPCCDINANIEFKSIAPSAIFFSLNFETENKIDNRANNDATVGDVKRRVATCRHKPGDREREMKIQEVDDVPMDEAVGHIAQNATCE